MVYLTQYGVYVTREGAVLSVATRNYPSLGHTKGTLYIHPQYIDRYGYLVVHTNKCNVCVHRLLALAYISNPDNKPTVDHINRVKTDNRLENLRWATGAEQELNKDRTIASIARYRVRRRVNPLEYARARRTAHSVEINARDRDRYSTDASYRERKKESARHNAEKHYALGETYHLCKDGHRRWHRPGDCPCKYH